MKQNGKYFCLLLGFFISIYGQAFSEPQLLWQNTYVTTESAVHGYDMVIDKSSNIHVAGHIYSTGGTIQDAAYLKFSSTGGLVHINKYDDGSGWQDYAYAIDLDTSGNVYVGGTGGSSLYPFVRKYDSAGNILTTKVFTPGYGRQFNVLKIDTEGNIWVASWYSGGATWDSFIVKLNSDLYEIWRDTISTGGDDVPKEIVFDSSGNVYYLLNSQVRKYDSSGNLLGSKDVSIAYGIAVDTSSYVYVLTSAGITKYDTSFNTVWIQNYGGVDGNNLAFDLSYNLYRAVNSKHSISNGEPLWQLSEYGTGSSWDTIVDSEYNIYDMECKSIVNGNYITLRKYKNPPPDVVTTLSATPGNYSIALNWIAPGDDGTTGGLINQGVYKVKYSTNLPDEWGSSYSVTWATSTSPGVAESRIITGLAKGVTYYFWLKTKDDVPNNWSELSNGATAFVLPDTTPPTGNPSTPTDNGVYNLSASVTFYWTQGTSEDGESGIAGYYLQVSTAPAPSSGYLFDSEVGNILVKEVPGGITGVTYYARVRAKNADDLYGDWSAWSDGIMVDTSPPSGFAVRDGRGDDISVTNDFWSLSANWDIFSESGSGINRYRYGIGTSSGGTDVVNWTDNSSSTEIIKTGLFLTYNTTYFISVKAEDNAGNLSDVITTDGQVAIDSSPPQGLPDIPSDEGAYSATSTMTFTWTIGTSSDIESGIAGYWLEVRDDLAQTRLNEDVGTVPAKNISGGITGRTYQARVKTRNGQGLWSGLTDWSDGILVDTSPPVFYQVNDGLETDIDILTTTSSLSANWRYTDDESGMQKYYYAIGTAEGGVDVINWTETASSWTTRVLTLVQATTYYFSVKAQNNSGLITEISTSDGIYYPVPAGIPDRVYYNSFFTDKSFFDIYWTSGTLSDPTGISGYWLQVATSPSDCETYLKDQYIGNYTTWTVTGAENGKTYFCRVKGRNGLASYSGWSKWSEGVYIDQTAPAAPAAVRDGLGADISVTNSSSVLSANWDNASDPETNIARYRYAIGVNPSGSDVVDWTEATLWESKNPSGGITSRDLYGYSYDLNEKKIVLFGGYNGSPLSDTWVYDIAGNQWTDKNPSGSPSGRRGIKMVYDPDNKKHILFGGNSGLMLSDTYVYDLTANSWENKNPGTPPEAREYYAMAFDKFNGKVILFGGYEGSTRFGDTWAYDLNTNTWQNMNPSTSPSARYAHSMVYDNVNRQIIMFGGNEAGAIPLNDTWIYNFRTNTWTEKTITNKPTARYEHMMTYDLQNKRVIMFGGFLSPNYYNDAWYYNVAANNWYQFNVSSAPVSRYGGNMIYDIDSKQSFVFGGYKQGYLNDTIAFKPGNYVSHSGLSLAENTTYYYSVRYANGAGTEGVLSSDGQYYNSSYNPNPAPVISAISPAYGLEGATVTISGAYFGSSQGGSYVRFYNNITVAISSWSDTSITCIVPSGAETGNVTVATENGTSNGTGFSVIRFYTISGFVKNNSSNALTGVTVSLSGYASGSVQTDNTGYYYFQVTTNNYVVTPSSTDWSFSPVSRSYTPIVSTASLQNFFGTYTGNNPPTLTWTGEAGYASDGLEPETGASTTTFTYRVKYTDIDNNGPNAGHPKVHILKGGGEISGSPFTMSYISGSYSAGAVYSYDKVNLSIGTDYTYYFEAQDSAGASAVGVSTGAKTGPVVSPPPAEPIQTYTISGYVMNHSSNALVGVTVSLSGYGSNYVMTNSSGQYSFSITTNNYVITPSSANWSFSPSNRNYTTVLSTQTEQNFFGTYISLAGLDTFTISGYVKNHSSTALSGVTVSLSGYLTDSKKTDITGYYEFLVTTNNYVVTPSSVNWSFFPANRNYATVLSTQTAQNFFGIYTYIPTVPADTLTISGYVKDHSSSVLVGVTVALSGYGTGSVKTDTNGQYSFSITTNNYVITPSSSNWSFSPSNRNYATVLSTRTEQNFFGTYILPAVANSSPTLTWTGEAGYTGDGVFPDSGASTDTYTFRIKYADANGDAPASGYPKVHILKGGGEITNSPFAMSEVSGGYSSGMIYTFAKSDLVVGTDYTYYFEAQDSSGAVASGSPVSPRSGPAVSAPVVIVLPVISVSPTSLDFGEITIGQSKSMTFAITDSNLSNSLSGTLSVDQSWISLSQLTASGNSTTITVTVNTGGMPAGTFSGTITITSNGGNSSVTVRVAPTCIITGPNPFRPGNGRKLIFRGNGVPNGTIWVYSLSGELLQEMKETEGKYALEWDGILSDGNLISSGIYFYTGTNPKEPTGNKGYFTVRK